MYNQNSIIVQNMMNNGSFGYGQPMQQQNYNPYANNGYNNMIPMNQFTGYGYYQGMPQYQYQQPQQYVFSPVSSYDYNAQMRNNNYYDPYGNTFTQQSIGGYNYNYPYYGYGYNPMGYAKFIQQQDDMARLKYKIAATYSGVNLTDEDITNIITPPQQNYRKMTDQERLEDAEYEFIQRVVLSANSNIPQPETNAQRTARILREISYNKHKELDDHSLCQFLEEDLWKLQREFWIKENIVKATRNLGSTYSSNDYTDILNMHRSSNPFVNDLLDTSRYDNNLDDMEIGMNVVFDAERRRQNILNAKVPSFISSPEVQERRRKFTEMAMAQIYQKNGGNK